MKIAPNDRIVMIGDSVTDCGRVYPVGEDQQMGNGYVALFSAMLDSRHPELSARVTNMGINGHTVRDLKARWQTDVLDLSPDWVTIMIGINDVWRQFDCPAMPEEHNSPELFESTYEALIQRTLPHVKGMILMTPFFMEPNKADAMRARMDEYSAIVRKLAEKYDLVFVDLQAAWDDLFQYMHPCNIAWDRVHPNQTGCMYIAKQFLKAVGAERC